MIKKRGVRWTFLYAFLLVVSVWAVASAASTPILSHERPEDEREFVNVYQSIVNPVISTGTAQNFTIINSSVSRQLVQYSTITNLSVTGTYSGITLGKIKQIQYASINNNSTSSTSTSFVNTNLAVSITPTSTASKILVIAEGVLDYSSTGQSGNATLDRNGTNLGDSTLGLSYMSSLNGDMPCTVMVLDSPSSVSALTYTAQIRTSSALNTVKWCVGTVTCTIFAMEIL